MGRLTLSRRSFLKLSAVTAAATALGATAAPVVFAETLISSDESGAKRVRTACRGCGKMECGSWAVVKDGRVIRIEGDNSAFMSHGNCCSKSIASLQAAYNPTRLQYPLKRSAPKGEEAAWQRITWDEAMDSIVKGFNTLIDKYGGSCNFTMGGTSRVWAQTPAYTGFKALLKTRNSIQALQVCKGPRFYAGALCNDMGIYWYEGTGSAPVYVQWGTAPEYSNYDNSCRTMVSVATNAKYHILIDPRITPLGKEADYWLPVRPGTDGAIAMCWTNIVIQRELYNDNFVKRWTNGPLLMVDELQPSGGFVLEGTGGIILRTRILKESDIVEGGAYLRFMAWDLAKQDAGLTGNACLTYWDNNTHTWEGEVGGPQTKGREVASPDPRVSPCFLPDETTFEPFKEPALYGTYDVTLKDGTVVKARPIWDRYAEICAKYTLEETEKITGVPAKLIEEACLTWVNPLDPTTGYGNGGLHYQLAPDQCGNAIQSERAMAILSAITNNTDVPGGNRGQTRMLGVNGSPGGAPDDKSTIQFPRGTISFMGNASMVDAEIFPLNRWFNFWSDCECTWDAALTGKPYYIKGGICCAADFMSMSNSKHAHDALAALEFFVALELWHTPTTELADIILPAAHWLELDSPRMSQGASGAIGATVKCIEPPGEARSDVAISLGMFKAFGLPWSANPEKPFFELEDELNASVAGMRMTWREYAEAFQSHGWWDCREISYIWHNYRRWEAGCLRQIFSFGTIPPDGNVGFYTPTGLTEIWSTVMESHGNTPHLCLPDFHEPPRSPISSPDDYNEYPLLMTTGSRQPVYFHSEHRQLPWCREQWPVPRVEMHPDDAKELGLEQGDWVWIENANGRVREVVDFYYGIAKGTVNANHQWWFPENVGPDLGYDLCNINIINYKDDKDPVCGAATLRAFPCKIYKATPENSPYNDPIPRDPVTGERIIYSADDPRLKEWLPTYEGRE